MVTSYSAPSCTFLKGYYSCQVLMKSLLYFQKYDWFCHPSSGVTTGEVINLLIYVTQKLKYFRKENGYFKRKTSLFVVSKSRSCKLQLFLPHGHWFKKKKCVHGGGIDIQNGWNPGLTYFIEIWWSRWKESWEGLMAVTDILTS